MSPQLALLVYGLLVLAVLRLDRLGREGETSSALWLPLVWLFLVSSKYPSEWLPSERVVGGEIYLDGSPLDRNIFLALILVGFVVLRRRKPEWSQLVRENRWIFLFFLYCGISAVWSDYPLVSLKRWFKGAGNILMVLLILTEPAPHEALKAVMRRLAYVYVPLSILLIKYFPALGRQFDPWTGLGMYVGAATSKNSLGSACMMCGVFMFWSLISTLKSKAGRVKLKDLALQISFLALIVWLQLTIESATSLACLVVAVAVITAITVVHGVFHARAVGPYVLLLLLLSAPLLIFFDVLPTVAGMLGRDTTFTGRTALWQDVTQMVRHPLLGVGYETFWLGERLERLWELHWWRPNQSHNGYLETYVNLGWTGLALLAVLIVSLYRNANRTMAVGFDYARVQFAILVITLLYNVTEAAFKGLSLVWIMFLAVSVRVPSRAPGPRGAA